jgi:hypothetical protein
MANGDRLTVVARSYEVSTSTVTKWLTEMKAERWTTIEGKLLNSDQRNKLIKFEETLLNDT